MPFSQISAAIGRRAFVLGGASLLGAAVREKPRHVTVFEEPARYGGWPANHGLWAWKNEIVVGYTAAWYKPATNDHAVDRSKKFEDWQSRSLDAGQTWTVERLKISTSGDNFVPDAPPLRDPLDLTAPGFAMLFGMGSMHGAKSWFYTSRDRARSWDGPYAFRVEGIDKLAMRTNYVVYGKRECVVYGSAAKQNDKEGRVFCARTLDGGLTWKLLSLIGPEPSGYMIMPSTVRLKGGRLLTAIRHKDPDKPGSIDFYASEDAGKSWSEAGAIGDIGGGNPPSLVRMKDGRLSLTYGYRKKPWGARARLSEDQGRSWSEELVLRDDGLTGDLGYPVSVQRPDGSMFAAYYFNGPKTDDQRTIQGTIWKW